MTKEGCLEKNSHLLSNGHVHITSTSALKAMDEWAKLKATEFLTWHTNKFNEYVALLASGQPFYESRLIEMKEFENATIEGRYELFLKSKTENGKDT